jgi:hypothetical protein
VNTEASLALVVIFFLFDEKLVHVFGKECQESDCNNVSLTRKQRLNNNDNKRRRKERKKASILLPVDWLKKDGILKLFFKNLIV